MKNKNSLVYTSIICVVPLIAGLILINSLPAQIPVQWSSNGEVNTYAPKLFAIVGVPLFFLLMNFFLYSKAEKSDLSYHYPESMKLFLKWSMPMLAVISTALSYASALGNSMLMASISSIVGVVIVLIGSYFYKFINSEVFRKIFLVKDDKAEKVYILCGYIFNIFGIAATILSVIGFFELSFVFSILAVLISFVYSRIQGK